MSDVNLIYADASCEVHHFVVGPIDNNVYIIRCRETGEATLLDAANEHERLLEVARRLGVKSVLETHGHWDHVGAVSEVREAGIEVWVREEDAGLLPSYDKLLEDDSIIEVGKLRLRTIHTPGHTPGSICFALENTNLLFTGDTLFPGGVGNATFEGGDFTTLIASVEERLFRPYDADTLFFPGHGTGSSLGVESPHLDEWVARGW
jgi:glyoxylase-like metal-dependent hydrolase (beta-lactamase superfamily II)